MGVIVMICDVALRQSGHVVVRLRERGGGRRNVTAGDNTPDLIDMSPDDTRGALPVSLTAPSMT